MNKTDRIEKENSQRNVMARKMSPLLVKGTGKHESPSVKKSRMSGSPLAQHIQKTLNTDAVKNLKTLKLLNRHNSSCKQRENSFSLKPLTQQSSLYQTKNVKQYQTAQENSRKQTNMPPRAPGSSGHRQRKKSPFEMGQVYSLPQVVEFAQQFKNQALVVLDNEEEQSGRVFGSDLTHEHNAKKPQALIVQPKQLQGYQKSETLAKDQNTVVPPSNLFLQQYGSAVSKQTNISNRYLMLQSENSLQTPCQISDDLLSPEQQIENDLDKIDFSADEQSIKNHVRELLLKYKQPQTN